VSTHREWTEDDLKQAREKARKEETKDLEICDKLDIKNP
jgi:hypothetical protein